MIDRFVRPVSLGVTVLAATLSSCKVANDPEPITPSEVRPEMVTGLAASALQPTGRFRFPSPFLVAGQITLGTAQEQSLQYAKYITNHVILRGVVEGERGRWVDPHLLTLCADAYFVRSQVVPPPLDSIAFRSNREMVLRSYGPHWVIPLCNDRKQPEMTVEVAVDGNDFVFRDNAPVAGSGSVVFAYAGRGVPFDWPDALPVTAERAVRYTFDQLGVRVAEVPELYMRGQAVQGGAYTLIPSSGSARGCNRWLVTLERDVQLRGASTNTVRSTRTVWISNATCGFLDFAPVLQVPLPVQPANVVIEVFDEGGIRQVPVEFVAPTYFEVAQRVSGQ